MADGTAAAAEQLGSFAHLLVICFCLVCSVLALRWRTERKVEAEHNEDAAEENEAPNKLCSACGKKSDTLKKCNGCKCVWYCDKKCQNKHRKEHKNECRRIKKVLDKRGGKLDLGTELDLCPIGKVPPREECPICMQVLPIHVQLRTYFACCGKTLCGGCNFQHQMKSEEEGVPPTCAFCRTPLPESDEEVLARLRKRVKCNDPQAIQSIALKYGNGLNGLQVDQDKCIDLLRKSAGLGYPLAQYQLGYFHDDGDMGLEQNEEEALKYYKEAAEGGQVLARHDLSCAEAQNGDPVAAMRHCRLSASAGFRLSMKKLVECFEKGILHHGDLAETLQNMYLARAEMKSKDRDQFIKYLKETGKYLEAYDW